MKRKLITTLISSFVLLFALVAHQFAKTIQHKENILAKIQILPSFSVKDVNGNIVTNRDIPANNWIIFVFFNTECHYCKSEAEQLKNISKNYNNTFIWISTEGIDKVKAFQKEYALEHIVFVSDTNYIIEKEWGISSIPQFLIYNPQKKLFKNHRGALLIENILSQINEETKGNPKNINSST